MFLQCNHICVCVYVNISKNSCLLKEMSQGCSFRQIDAPFGCMNGEGNSLVSCGKAISTRVGSIADVVHLFLCLCRI